MINLSFSFYDFEYFLLVLVRITCFVHTAPFFTTQGVPARLKVAFSLFLSYLVYSIMVPMDNLFYTDTTVYTIAVMKEVLVGLLLGLGANMCSSIINFASRIIDMEMGLAMVSLMDPTTKENATITGVFYQYMIMLMMMISGMYQYFVRAIVDSFILIPVNGAIINFDRLLESLVAFLGNYIVVGFRICLPIFCVITLLNAILGVLAKVSPQMNMFAVGIQIKVLVGMGIMFVTIILVPSIANFIFNQMKTMIVAFVESLGGSI